MKYREILTQCNVLLKNTFHMWKYKKSEHVYVLFYIRNRKYTYSIR